MNSVKTGHVVIVCFFDLVQVIHKRFGLSSFATTGLGQTSHTHLSILTSHGGILVKYHKEFFQGLPQLIESLHGPFVLSMGDSLPIEVLIHNVSKTNQRLMRFEVFIKDLWK